ncbi:acylneuraminate cytidylyltransferase [Oleidesulfovibrio alaskensis G20]|uniref:Acylneuraminate cytidylyltransferase n=1 Tax=Oleidesulfovibrio alaskensis (strain ATCC BAA-1058 / DSM 17464 / G20) TaxID=207559 RepID=Q30V24_OLEA2|nr:NTP transferase domain-containing protein [Oleidesulfovibrio alaskensis]ABB40472.1 acylneuraminate cytidylyltransferase [Oleidesulfovibrio alaskensis G20]MBG0772726.1 NTP transferase domain-containing protein [Oleidesulfovibrio alaskensis]MBL3583182.1 NTP transferase domain-containing protein [Oleidesulfovibrio alaskensis]
MNAVLQKKGGVGIIILARLDSTRLPGKALRTAAGKEMLGYVVERARMVRGVSEIVLATTDRTVDDRLEEYAAACDLAVFRGSDVDVAGRVAACVRWRGWDAFVRINGDSPFIDPQTISSAVNLLYGLGGVSAAGLSDSHAQRGNMHAECASLPLVACGSVTLAGYAGHDATELPDMVTNVLRRTFPKGQSVEVCRASAFLAGYAAMHLPEHLEHVTKYFYDTRSIRIMNMESGDPSLGEIQLAVDTEEDFALFERMLARMDRPHTAYAAHEIIELYRECLHG